MPPTYYSMTEVAVIPHRDYQLRGQRVTLERVYTVDDSGVGWRHWRETLYSAPPRILRYGWRKADYNSLLGYKPVGR